ncbi:Regulatory protein NPR4 [Dendrobium catenatum]|uniref:Regulatory protein NPR4 n=1 Tax=Dendrobium catenatum TaxID=906689 RepID=A0A2I0VZ26_9ASPA|nr:Regulatory protein NPR4 [Dendrobium catenatum]
MMLLHYAATCCDSKVIAKNLDVRLAYVNLKYDKGYTPFHISVMHREPAIIVSLLTKGASASETTGDGQCAVFPATISVRMAISGWMKTCQKPMLELAAILVGVKLIEVKMISADLLQLNHLLKNTRRRSRSSSSVDGHQTSPTVIAFLTSESSIFAFHLLSIAHRL